MAQLDWNDVWKSKMAKSSWNINQKDLVQFWDKKAEGFYKNMKQHQERGERTIAKMDISPEDTVLDVGAGTGAVSIPLAKKVKHVTAAEPSTGMLAYLKQYAKEEKINNLTCLNKKWEDVNVEKDLGNYDIVFASYSIMMSDIKDALEKMNKVANKAVYLFTFAGIGHDKLPMEVFGKEFSPGPDYICILNVLHQMGIYANVNITKQENCFKYSSLESAVQTTMERFNKTSENDEKKIREYFKHELFLQNGELILKEKSHSAKIWWTK